MNEFEITSRKAEGTDIAFLLHLRNESMDTHLKQMGIHLSDQEHLERVKHGFEGAEIILVNQERAGLLKRKVGGNQVELLQFQLLPRFQGKGLGTKVLTEFIQQVKSKGQHLTLKVLKKNPAKLLYERLGFVVFDEDQHEFYMEFKNDVPTA